MAMGLHSADGLRQGGLATRASAPVSIGQSCLWIYHRSPSRISWHRTRRCGIDIRYRLLVDIYLPFADGLIIQVLYALRWPERSSGRAIKLFPAPTGLHIT